MDRQFARLASAMIATALLISSLASTSADARRPSATGSLALHTEFKMVSNLGDCPAGMPDTMLCATRTGRAFVSGLGDVTEDYLYPIVVDPPGCASGTFHIMPFTVRFTVRDKGQIDLSVPGSKSTCLFSALRPVYPPISVVGGSGLYTGASGSGSLTSVANYTTSGGAAGPDTWEVTLLVPGLDFNVTPPIISGASNITKWAKKRAQSARVSYTLSARDDVDGNVPVACMPESGTRFTIGPTAVHCSAVDKSGNVATATFTVRVKKVKKS